MRNRLRLLFALCALFLFGSSCLAQSGTGTLQVTARISATGGRPEPVREFTLYILTMSFREVQGQVSAEYPLADRDTFVENLKISPELKEWLKKHGVIDLVSPDMDKMITPDDVINVPEFFGAYQRSNGGGVTKGLPMPKFKDSDKEANPEKYEKQHQEYLDATKKFVQEHPTTMAGIETELGEINPKYAWDKAQQQHNQKVSQLAPDLAQSKFMAAKGDTDLDGRLGITGLPPGNYWVSSLGMYATSGDRRLMWDVPVRIEAGQVTRVDLSNVNGKDFNSAHP